VKFYSTLRRPAEESVQFQLAIAIADGISLTAQAALVV